MDGGKILEMGAPEELLMRGDGVYRRIRDLQEAALEDDEGEVE